MTWTCHICGTLATTSNALVLNGGPIVHRGCVPDDSPLCDCPAASEEWPHTEADHRADCPWTRGGPPESACGGCWGCLAAQARYDQRKRWDVAS